MSATCYPKYGVASYKSINNEDNLNSASCPTDSQRQIITEPVIARSSEEAQRIINLPWMPPPPAGLIDPETCCQFSSYNPYNIFYVLVLNNVAFICITLLALCFGFWCLYSLIDETLQQTLQDQFQLMLNATKTIKTVIDKYNE